MVIFDVKLYMEGAYPVFGLLKKCVSNATGRPIYWLVTSSSVASGRIPPISVPYYAQGAAHRPATRQQDWVLGVVVGARTQAAAKKNDDTSYPPRHHHVFERPAEEAPSVILTADYVWVICVLGEVLYTTDLVCSRPVFPTIPTATDLFNKSSLFIFAS